MPAKKSQFTYIDLFAGCGGLSLGLETEGGQLLVAVERSPMAAETFYHNLVKTIPDEKTWDEYVKQPLNEQVNSKLLVSELGNLLEDSAAVSRLASENPDLVVGGPPCQGFSLAGRRNPEDKRNQLPWQFLDLVEKTQPKMVVIENVVGMRHKFSADQTESVFDQLQQALRETGDGYEVQAVEVNALHYGAPQHRPRLMIIGLRNDLAQKFDVHSTGNLWKSNFTDLLKDVPPLAPRPTVASDEIRTVLDAVGDLPSNQVTTPSRNANQFLELMTNPKHWSVTTKSSVALTNHVRRNHQPHAVKRFRLYQALSAEGIDPRILSKTSNLDEAEAKSFLRKALSQATFPSKSPDGHVIAKNLVELVDLCWALKTKKHSQKVLAWDKPSKTVVTIGDDYVHPSEPRTFTVRELARFQGFPDSFEFRAKETTGGLNRRNEVPQYSQVGNAVSPFLALAVGKMVNTILEGETESVSKI